MEAFKLLSRATNLKPAQNSDRERRGLHVPSEGTTDASTGEIEGVHSFLSGVISNGRKRKRDGSQSVEYQAKSLDSSVYDNSVIVSETREGQSQAASESNRSKSPSRLSPEECHSVFNSHKVKVVPLTGDLRSAGSETKNGSRKAGGDGKASTNEPLSHKKQKEALKLYTQPLTSFALLKTLYNGPKALSNNIREQGYISPTEVQLATIPLLVDPTAAGLHLPSDCQNIDLLTIAPTGSGKTLAFLIPLIHHLVHDHHDGTTPASSRHVSALIIAPTKELASQTVNEGRKLCRNTGVSITAMRKGMHIATESNGSLLQNGDEQHSALEADNPSLFVRSDILVTTPLLLANTIREDENDLSSVRYLILDEADVLLDPLFRDQTLSLWTACNNPSLRVTLWSATIGSNIEELVIQLTNERRIRLGIQDKSPLLRCIIGLKDSALPTITHKLIYAATEPGKLLGLRQLLHPSSAGDGKRNVLPLRPPFLVFTQTIERAIALHAELLYDIPIEAGGSSRLAVLHSDLSDSKRSEIMARFRKGQIWVLITTDLLSRGIDFRGVNGVVNYDIPTSSAAYVHRAGRTGRAGREGGVAVTFYTREDVKYVKAIANAIAASEKARGQAAKVEIGGEDGGVQKWLLNALPDISKKDRQELKKRGVEVRRKIRAGEDDKEAKAKRKARISTKSGYERRLENNRKRAIEAVQDRHDESEDGGDDRSDGWGGFDE